MRYFSNRHLSLYEKNLDKSDKFFDVLQVLYPISLNHNHSLVTLVKIISYPEEGN